MTDNFVKLGIRESLEKALQKDGITVPTKIQEIATPLMLQRKDVIAKSPTGSGKTLAYVLPMFETLAPEKLETQAMVLVPTHEVAIQVIRVIEGLATNSGIRLNAAPIIGNVNITRQIDKLKEKPQIIVGTAGRILELIKKKKISAHTVKTIVLDEADRLLDENNQESVLAVIKTTLKDRQLALFSASINQKTIDTVKGLLKEPIIIKGEEKIKVPETIEHLYFVCEQRDKVEILRKVFRIVNPGKAIAFVHKSADIDILTEKLQYHGINAKSICGGDAKLNRKKIMDDFRKGDLQLLIATDIAARGLDIEDVTHIFNVELPEDSQNYLHRVGRTGRKGKEGCAISIATERELPLIRLYQKDLKITIKYKDMFKGNLIDGKRSFKKK
jgi:superfamily II DNA/RNA helicase